MLVIDYSTSYKALSKYVLRYNQEKPKGEQIKLGILFTAKELIRIYGASLLKANAIRPIDVNDLPSLQTNNVQLSHFANCTTRTIQRHIKRLQEAKIIIQKVNHGTNSGYELWLNPEVIRLSRQITKKYAENQLKLAFDNFEKDSEQARSLSFNTTKSPHTYTCNNNNIIIAVDKLTSSDKNDSAPIANNLTGYETGYTGGKESEEKKQIETGGKELRAGRSDSGESVSEAARLASLQFYVEQLWHLAKNLLYGHIFLAESQVEIAKSLIRKFYAPVPDGQLSKIHRIYCDRIDLVARYIKKDPLHRFVQLPYLYFDTNNPNGFTGTKKWYESHNRRKKEVYLELLFNRQVKKFLNNIKKESDCQKPPLQVFRECENTLGKLKDPQLLKRFYATVLHPDTFCQLN